MARPQPNRDETVVRPRPWGNWPLVSVCSGTTVVRSARSPCADRDRAARPSSAGEPRRQARTPDRCEC